MEAYGKACFDQCPQPLDRGSDCYLVCYLNTMALITSDCDAMRCPEHQMALITSDCAAMRFPEHQMALTTSDCARCTGLLPQHADRRPGLQPDKDGPGELRD